MDKWFNYRLQWLLVVLWSLNMVFDIVQHNYWPATLEFLLALNAFDRVVIYKTKNIL